MELISEYSIHHEYFSMVVYEVDCHNMMNKGLGEEEVQEWIVLELARLIREKVEGMDDARIVNISLYESYYPLYFWDYFLQMAIDELAVSGGGNLRVRVFVSEGKNGDKKRYIHENSTLYNCLKSMATADEEGSGCLKLLEVPRPPPPPPPSDGVEYEGIIKRILLKLFQDYGISRDEDMGVVLSEYHSLQELLEDLDWQQQDPQRN
ncbi:hypothetical protein Kpol_1010p60 [Vanderwaltozyma polyspora DSM 70294]|uniref:Uncharacterized protein n=1 Tax=Vanderwaltozyma polyspora (strain ATCC 22028 / DSM 70294 / BCRC 21397 / CBS 2163 / NBRC 10782 / NRRL Y-8283 / UCD 57-17) TaxID=436907 RepID=A7TIK5_VANPO|nr:uncharacterized protein Kpol_1010p60 [Vanderwaltozyma polyspora DSM 70294]EDO17943.1 hypothetical protein Kpol_1010p60 [Vanderwaltozyma polyspora DSM 70294]